MCTYVDIYTYMYIFYIYIHLCIRTQLGRPSKGLLMHKMDVLMAGLNAVRFLLLKDRLTNVRCTTYPYGVATTCRLLKIIGFFCKRALQKRLYSAKETYNFEEPTSRSHPIYYI